MRRPWYTYVISFVVSVLVIVPAVWLCDWVFFRLPRRTSRRVRSSFAAVLALVGVVLQPVLVWAAVRLGWLGVFLLTFVGKAVVVLLTGALLPNVTVDGFWTAFGVGRAWWAW